MPQIIVASYEILSYPEDVLQRIEKAARTCYKSEDKITSDSAEKLVRNLIKRGHMAMIEFGGDVTVKFVSNRGFTHEMVRHRLCSFAQESTRYCNYGKGKFGNEITVCDPVEMLNMRIMDDGVRGRILRALLASWVRAEADYLELIDLGAPAEVAREVLPIGTKAEIVVEANVREWMHIFSQRASNKAHPRMRELMLPLLAEFQELMPIIFDGVGQVGS
jgi:thymidylate synthase (FAD)